jgi:hypothetical protein
MFSCQRKAGVIPPINLPGNGTPQEEDLRSARPNRSGSADIYFYYSETCPSCEDYQLAKQLESRLRQGAEKGYLPWRRVSFTSNNLLTQQQLVELQELLSEKGLPDVSQSVPIIIVKDELVVGYEEIELLIDGLLDF